MIGWQQKTKETLDFQRVAISCPPAGPAQHQIVRNSIKNTDTNRKSYQYKHL